MDAKIFKMSISSVAFEKNMNINIEKQLISDKNQKYSKFVKTEHSNKQYFTSIKLHQIIWMSESIQMW